VVRRLSITVPDELWDELTHLDPSPSALVQRALRCLHATEGPGAGPTPIEAAAADIPYWQSALDNLTDQATELRAEGYEAVIMGTYEGVVTLGWLEMVARDYRPDELPQLLADAGDVFLAQRHRVQLPGDEGVSRFVDRPVEEDEVLELLFGDPNHRVGSPWDEEHRELLVGLSSIIAIQETGHLATNANGTHFRLREVGEDRREEPTTDIPHSLWEGMTAAIFDTVVAVQRRVRTENNPATLGSFRR
jgi:hypothetical protein